MQSRYGGTIRAYILTAQWLTSPATAAVGPGGRRQPKFNPLNQAAQKLTRSPAPRSFSSAHRAARLRPSRCRYRFPSPRQPPNKQTTINNCDRRDTPNALCSPSTAGQTAPRARAANQAHVNLREINEIGAASGSRNRADGGFARPSRHGTCRVNCDCLWHAIRRVYVAPCTRNSGCRVSTARHETASSSLERNQDPKHSLREPQIRIGDVKPCSVFTLYCLLFNYRLTDSGPDVIVNTTNHGSA